MQKDIIKSKLDRHFEEIDGAICDSTTINVLQGVDILVYLRTNQSSLHPLMLDFKHEFMALSFE